MSTLRSFIRSAKADEPVYISRVRDAFEREGERPFHVHFWLYDDSVRSFTLRAPRCADAEERAFVASWLNATLYNALSALGAKSVDVYVDTRDAGMLGYARSLNGTFQVDALVSARRGYGKCLNVNQRTLASLCGQDARFAFHIDDVAREPAVPAPAGAPAAASVFAEIPARAQRGMWMGMDVGGTDVKVVAAVDGRLCAFREYDWNPAACARVEQIIDPLVMLARLMRAAACMAGAGLADSIPARAFERTAPDAQIMAAVDAMEARLGDRLRGLDGIGLCFPDVVIRNRIIGGETPKTQGLRANAALDYEAQFAKLAGLCDALRPCVRPGGPVLNVNDGPMAAFTAAVERAAAGHAPDDGFFAHTLGTDLGTGWVLPDGTIPELPLEVYNFIIDLGSFGQRAYPSRDARSVNSFSTALPGALQRYASQSGVFRLAAKTLPGADPAAWQGALDRGLFAWDGDRLTVPTAPADMRKPCLEYFMRAAEDAGSPCAELFRQVGEALAVTWRETQFLLAPACEERTLFGRLVKTRACFELIREGARRVVPDIRLEAADEAMANTPLMRQLAARDDCTVAQFGQAVGAIHYACAAGIARDAR